MPDDSSDQEVLAKPLIGVSRCLLGDPVRYDGASKRNRWIADVLSLHCDFLPVCPEVESGLGVPRPALQLVGSPQQPRALGVADSGLDVTEPLLEYFAQCRPRLRDVSGMILKSRSPSCGVLDTPVFSGNGQELAHGAGLFTRALLQTYPELPVIDENGLASESGRVGFLIQVFRYRRRQPPFPAAGRA